MARSLTDLRRMQKNQLKSITKDDLIDAILTPEEPSANIIRMLEDRLSTISKELMELRKAISSPDSAVNKKIEELQSRTDRQANIIMHQQLYLENLDRKERESNLIVLGVPDEGEALDGATDDGGKLGKVWTAIGEETVVRSHRRLGRRIEGAARKRPILVVVDSKSKRDCVLEKAKHLKDKNDNFNTIYIKKDVHPSVRNEWNRLRNAEKLEKEKPGNVGCNIHFDPKERKLYRDGIVIDGWNPQPF